MIVRLNERELQKLGYSQSQIDLMRHLMRQIGEIIGGETLPEVAARAGVDNAFDESSAARAQLMAAIEGVSGTSEAINTLSAQVSTLAQQLADVQSQVEDRSVADVAELAKALQFLEFDRPTDLTLYRGLAEQIAMLPDPSAALAEMRKASLSGQVKFPAAQNASADPNTLDDYEEGTFTPVVTGTTAAGVGTYSLQSGSYTKVGRLVSFNLVVVWTAHTGTGNLTITGLPFASAGGAPPCSITASDLTFTGQLVAYVLGSAVSLLQVASNVTISALPMDPTSTEVRVSGHYFVA